MLLYSCGYELWLLRVMPKLLPSLVSSLFMVGTAVVAAVVAQS